MRIYSYIEGTKVNGPGYRFCVWMQGCKRNCDGCFNIEACDMEGGYEIAVEELIGIIRRQKYDGVSVSGGEPFYQSFELEEFLRQARLEGLNTLVYTGYTYEELLPDNEAVLKFCDYIIDGPYRKNIPSVCKYAGSGNQRFLKLIDGKIVENMTEMNSDDPDCELIINPDGTILSTGIFDIF